MRSIQALPMLALLAPWASTPQADRDPCEKHQKPFIAPAKAVKSTVHTVALTPVRVPRNVSDSARRRAALLDTLLTRVLQKAQYTVIETVTTDSLWRAIRDSSGGLFDSNTGEIDSAKAAAVNDQFRQVLAAEFKADAVLYARVVEVGARFDNGSAQWDGAKESYANFGKRLVEAMGGGPYSGQTPALSLRTVLQRPDGAPLYDNWGGLQLLAIPRSGKFVPVPDAHLFEDDSRMAGAVRIAMCQLVRGKS
jgi:hypothetical protein